MKRKWLLGVPGDGVVALPGLPAQLGHGVVPGGVFLHLQGDNALWWQFGSDPAVSVLRGEHWGRIICGILLTAMPFTPLRQSTPSTWMFSTQRL